MDRAEAEAIALAGGERARELVLGLLDALGRLADSFDEVDSLPTSPIGVSGDKH